tara:strand:+ start:175 stop:354 length:180 start_codon:yes stop_codon:yes gene_type:complete
MSDGVILKKRVRKMIKYIDENKDMLEASARKAIKKASEKRNERTTKYKFGFEYKDRNSK